jgi:hypothetical protein
MKKISLKFFFKKLRSRESKWRTRRSVRSMNAKFTRKTSPQNRYDVIVVCELPNIMINEDG